MILYGLAKAIASHSLTGLNIVIFQEGLFNIPYCHYTAMHPKLVGSQTLRHFLKQVIKSEAKVESIGQCSVKSPLPRSFTQPKLFALAVELDHMFGSRWLNTQLFKLGFSESYSEVIRFKQTVAMIEEIGVILQSSAAEDNFTNLVGDNVDHNTTTLDGRGTFHGMGAIAVITNKKDIYQEEPL